jgi:phage gp36-like protein
MTDFPPPIPQLPLSSYGITVDDLAARLTARTLASVTDDMGGRNIDVQLVAQKIIEAEAVLHSYANVYYITPISDDSPDYLVVRKVAIDLAAWELLSRRPHAISGDTGEIERTRYEATLAWLKGLASRNRTVRLAGSAERSAPPPTSGGAETVADETQFTDEALASF